MIRSMFGALLSKVMHPSDCGVTDSDADMLDV